ncbi:hypothetical protein COCNU_03G014310 [Cocos nucifera]|uniref:Uncharacterized protein n=1 Tax=Cocos nucifera TaxID=13894 RepID=A0A8K0I3S9_COCNU|nr:hypothetical protein COCNU_03G014310 [Cocos nucifera]
MGRAYDHGDGHLGRTLSGGLRPCRCPDFDGIRVALASGSRVSVGDLGSWDLLPNPTLLSSGISWTVRS